MLGLWDRQPTMCLGVKDTFTPLSKDSPWAAEYCIVFLRDPLLLCVFVAEPAQEELETFFPYKGGNELIVECEFSFLTPYLFICFAPFQRSLMFLSLFRRVSGTNSSSIAHKTLYLRS